jgi:deoxyribonucleoside regulator
MKNSFNGESDDLMRVTASLYYIDGLAERKVAKLVGVSRSKVSRLLTQAREKGIVRISVDAYDPRNRSLETALQARFHLNHTFVIKTINAHSSADIRRAMGAFAAPFIFDLIHPQSVVGIAGGRSLAELIQSIPKATQPQNLTVVQLMGNIGPNVSSFDAIELSRVMAERLDGTFYTINAPAFAPDAKSRDVFLSHDHVRSIWQLFERMQTAFVGIGTLNDSAFIERGMLHAAELAKLRAQGVVGEICGRFYDARGVECNTGYGSRVISISLDALRRVRQVVGVTNGAERASAIVAALKSGIVKSLIIDERGAEAVLQVEPTA